MYVNLRMYKLRLCFDFCLTVLVSKSSFLSTELRVLMLYKDRSMVCMFLDIYQKDLISRN